MSGFGVLFGGLFIMLGVVAAVTVSGPGGVALIISGAFLGGAIEAGTAGA